MTHGYRCPACTHTAFCPGYCARCLKAKRYIRLKPWTGHEWGRLGDLSPVPLPRVALPGWPQLAHVLNGGLPLGRSLLVAAPPGAGKTTLAVGVCAAIAGDVTAMINTTEQAPADLREIADRCGYDGADAIVATAATYVDELIEQCDAVKPTFLVVDSLQELTIPDAGDGPMVMRRVCERLLPALRERGIACWLTCQVNKDDGFNGPRAVEHLVDGMAELHPVDVGAVLDTLPSAPPTMSTEDYAMKVGPIIQEAERGLTFTVVGKYRHGPVGRVARLRRTVTGRIEE